MTDIVNVVINVSFISLDKLTSVEEGPPACYRLTSPDFGVRRVPPRLTLTYDASMRNKRGALLTRGGQGGGSGAPTPTQTKH